MCSSLPGPATVFSISDFRIFVKVSVRISYTEIRNSDGRIAAWIDISPNRLSAASVHTRSLVNYADISPLLVRGSGMGAASRVPAESPITQSEQRGLAPGVREDLSFRSGEFSKSQGTAVNVTSPRLKPPSLSRFPALFSLNGTTCTVPADCPTRARRHGSVAGYGPTRWPPPAAPRAPQTTRSRPRRGRGCPATRPPRLSRAVAVRLGPYLFGPGRGILYTRSLYVYLMRVIFARRDPDQTWICRVAKGSPTGVP